jgi:CubicO group peptidase (beta-lactamase class C family)
VDLVQWDVALATERLVDRATLRLAVQPPVLPGGTVTEYGFGWFVDVYRGERRWRHTGETSGFTNAIQRFPDRRLTVIVLTNRNGGTLDDRRADRRRVVAPQRGDDDADRGTVFGVRKSAATRAALRFFPERRIRTHFVDLDERSPARASSSGSRASSASSG